MWLIGSWVIKSLSRGCTRRRAGPNGLHKKQPSKADGGPRHVKEEHCPGEDSQGIARVVPKSRKLDKMTRVAPAPKQIPGFIHIPTEVDCMYLHSRNCSRPTSRVSAIIHAVMNYCLIVNILGGAPHYKRKVLCWAIRRGRSGRAINALAMPRRQKIKWLVQGPGSRGQIRGTGPGSCGGPRLPSWNVHTCRRLKHSWPYCLPINILLSVHQLICNLSNTSQQIQFYQVICLVAGASFCL